ncbi:hypothetical protein J4404_02455 [Candidatus Woesearchaeota archaeon]|nr:hypothetical protein [Candidatus Woesearchaeota archaeon]
MSNLEDKLGITEKELASGKIALLIEDSKSEVEGIVHQGKKLVNPDRLKKAVEENYNLMEKLEINNDLLSMHRYFDVELRDAVKKQKKTVKDAISDSLCFLAQEIGAAYVGFHLNPKLREEGKMEAVYADYQCTEVMNTAKGYIPLNGTVRGFFSDFREMNPEFNINYDIPENKHFKKIEESVKQVNEENKMNGDAFTIYLKPGHDVIGAVQALRTRTIDPKKTIFVKEWVEIADTFISDMLKIKVEADQNERISEGDRITQTFDGYGGTTIEELTSEFTGGGDFNERVQPEVTKGGSIEEIERKKYEKGIRFVTHIYRERPELDVSKDEVNKDINSVISCMKIIQALYAEFGNKIAQDFKLSDGRDVDKETLENASIFSVAFARAIKYMHQADNIPKITEVRERNDMREMTSYLAELLETPELREEFNYHGEPLINRSGKPSLLGSTVIDISNKIDPNKESHFAVDLVEKVMAYEELVQDTTSSQGMEIDKALETMYRECVKNKDQKGMVAVKMIDKLVNPKGEDVYSKLKPK